MTAVIERASRIAVISRFLSCMRPTHNPWWVTGMDWFGFRRSIRVLVHGIERTPMLGTGNLYWQHAQLRNMKGYKSQWRHPADGKRNHREGLALSPMRVIHEQRDSRDGVMRDYHLVLLTTCVLSCNRYSL